MSISRLFGLFTIVYLSLITSSTNGYGQERSTDYAPVCLSPSGTITNGDTPLLRFIIINHGPDAELQGDVFFYEAFILDNGDTSFIYRGPLFPPTPLGIGDSVQYNDNYGIRMHIAGLTEPKEMDMCIRIFTRAIAPNGDTAILPNDDPDLSNNTCCKKVILVPDEGVGISDRASVDELFVVFPNPASSNILLVFNKAIYASRISIRDITGKVLFEQVGIEGTRQESINVSQFNNGWYILTVNSELGSASKRLLIRR